MKGKAVVLVLAGVGVMSGMTLSAGATEDLWSYELAADGAGDQVYQFRDVELTIPADWDGKYGLEVDEDANFPYGTVSVYHKASQEALSAEYGQENSGGYLFTLTCSDDYDFMDVLPSYRIIGETDGYVYYVSLPTDVQGYMEDDAIWAEWLQLSGDTDWVVSNITVTNPGEGVVDMDQVSQNASDAAQDADVLIQPNVIHVLRLAVQPRNQMAGNCRAEEAADILAFAALTGAVHRQQSVTHARERGLFQPAAACAGITVELQHKRERLIALRTQIFGVNARAAHAREPQVEVFTGRIGRNFGWFDGVAQRHCVGFRHARVPERVKIGGARGRAAIRGIGHRGIPPHSK